MDQSILRFEEEMWELTEESRRAMPEANEAVYGRLGPAVYGDGALPALTKRLMALAVAVQAGCRPCILSQAGRAIKLGATPEQMIEACQVAVSMGGTLAWSHALVLFEYLRARDLLPAGSQRQQP